jgi:segregation and condensation protein B
MPLGISSIRPRSNHDETLLEHVAFTRPQIEAIRGVNCDGVLKTLLARELIEAVGRLEQPGRPFLYGTTFQFLQYFGLGDLSDLPTLPQPSSSAEKGT